MRDIDSEVIEFKNDCTFYGLLDELWGEAKAQWMKADLETRTAVWDRVQEYAQCLKESGELIEMGTINDMIWFDCDDLFFPPTLFVRVYKHNADTEESTMIHEERFEGIGAKEEAEEWWNDNQSEYDSENEDEIITAYLVNDQNGHEEEL